MIRISVALACMTAASGCGTASPSQPEGFSGYAFHSSYDGIRNDMTDEGYTLVDSDERSLWYEGDFVGYPTEFAYNFARGELSGGYFDIQDQSVAAWKKVESELDEVYPGAKSMPCSSGNPYCRIVCSVDAKIIHLLTDDRDVHVLRYYERSPVNGCDSDHRSD